MAASKKKILIANIPLNGARDINTGEIDNTPRVIYFNEATNSLEIQCDGEIETTSSGSADDLIGTIDYTDINALAADPNVSINFPDKLPKNSIPEYIVAVIETPFVMGGAPITFSMDSQIENTGYNTISLASPGGINWSNFILPTNTKIAAKYNVQTFVGLTIAQAISMVFNFTDNTGTPVNNPKSLTAGRVRLYTYYRNFST